MKKNSGITLIALIITIIIMLILVAVTVSILINSGIIGKAQKAKQDTTAAYEREATLGDSLSVNGTMYNSIDEYIGSPTAGTPVSNPASYGDNAQAISDGEGNYFPLPTGATYIEGTVATGIVIGYKGSQFVFIPINSDLTVKGTDKLMAKESTADGFTGITNGSTNYEGVLYNFSVNGDNITSEEMSNYGQGTSASREPDSIRTYDRDTTYISTIGCSTEAEVKAELQGSYNEMIDSVKRYGGFYVGRYESSINGTAIASVSGATPMNSVNWYEMYKKQKGFSGSGTDSMQSSMIWGSQYDAMINWMLTGAETEKVDSVTNAIHNRDRDLGALQTGTTATDVINNIYDIEGNCVEWTAEANSNTFRILRGGSYCFESASWERYIQMEPWADHLNHSSRMALYIK